MKESTIYSIGHGNKKIEDFFKNGLKRLITANEKQIDAEILKPV